MNHHQQGAHTTSKNKKTGGLLILYQHRPHPAREKGKYYDERTDFRPQRKRHEPNPPRARGTRRAMTHADYMALLHAAQRAIYARQRLTGARLNLSYTTPADIVADAWIIGATTCRPTLDAIPEATRRAYRAQQRHTHFCIDDCLHAPELSTAGQDIADEISPPALPPTLARLSEGYALAEIAAHTGRSVSAVWKQKNQEMQEFFEKYGDKRRQF